MKILLLQPIVPIEVRWGKFKKASGFVPPLGLVNIAGYLDSKGYDVTVCDAQLERFTEEDLANYLSKGKYDLIGIPAFTNSIMYSFKTAEVCKKILPNSTVVFGSVHASILPEQVLQDCSFVDIVVMGEGEYIMEDIINSLKYNQPSFSEIIGIAYRKDDG